MPTAGLMALLQSMHAAELEFIVIGGVAAVLHGAPITTRDLDILYRKTPENIERLFVVLQAAHARFADLGGRTILPTRELLAQGRQLLLITDEGPLDCLAELNDGRGYDDLLQHTETFTNGHLQLQILDLHTLIETKLALGRARDRLVVPVLLAVLRERTGSEGPSG